jgi:hypothetical protein
VDVPTSGFAVAMYAILDDLGIAGYELVALGSTPKRLQSLLAGECDATMLNAGNELLAEDAGFSLLAAAPKPYLGTVLVSTSDRSDLAHGLTATAAAICAGEHDELVLEEASRALGLSAPLAKRYLERLVSPDEGLVADGAVDPAAMETITSLRQKYRR